MKFKKDDIIIKSLINDTNICERLDPTIKKVQRRINYINRNYNVSVFDSNPTNKWQRLKVNLLWSHLNELKDAKFANDDFDIACAIYNYERDLSLI